MGDLWQQMAETAGTDEAEAARKAEEADWPKKQLRQRRRRRLKSAIREAAELARDCRGASARDAAAEATRNAVLALEAAQKAEEESLRELPFSARCLILVRRLQFLQQLASQRLPLKKRLLRLRDDGAPSAVEAAASEAAAMGDCCNRWQWPLSPMRQSSPRG